MKPIQRTIQRTAIVLIILGALALIYGGINYSREVQEVSPGLVKLPMDDGSQINVPLKAGVGGILVGGLMFFFGRPARY